MKTEFLHAWSSYRRYAWGHDDLDPISKKPRDWYGKPLLMTPVDALDTLILLGFRDEADAARELIATKLDFDQDIYVKNFEITIRLLGGLLSSYQLTGDERLLHKAEDLGRRLLPVFDSPTGLPYVEVNLHTGKTRGTKTNPAETGTLLLEFGTLSKLTGKPEFYAKAKRALVETWKRRSPIDLVGEEIDAETGQWTSTDSHVSGGIDSYYEYLWKCARLFGDEECASMWKPSIAAVNRYLADDVDGALWYGYADMRTGVRTHTTFGALDAFFPALLALSGDVKRAARLQDSAFAMWQVTGIEPEVYDYRTPRDAVQGLCAPAGDRRVDVLPLPLHARSEISRDGPHDVPRLRALVPHRRRLRGAIGRRHEGEEGPHGKLRLRRDVQVLLPSVRTAGDRFRRGHVQHRGASAPRDLERGKTLSGRESLQFSPRDGTRGCIGVR